MLKKLQVKNFAIIDDVELNLGEGLCVLTGETGAGKTLIIEAINLLIGERADSSLIRDGEDKLLVQGFFDFSHNSTAIKFLIGSGLIDQHDSFDEIIISREVNRNEKNRAFINGIFLQVSILKELGSIFIDIHGQHDHQYLLDSKHHMQIIDKFGKKSIQNIKEEYQNCFNQFLQVQNKLNHLKSKEKVKEEQLNDLRYRVGEIEALNVKEGEQEALEQELKILKNYQKIFQYVSDSVQLLKGDDDHNQSLVDNMGILQKNLSQLSGIDGRFMPFLNDVSGMNGVLDDLSHFLNSYLSDFEYSPQRLDNLQERLFKLEEIKGKYSMSLEEINQYALKLKQQIENYDSLDQQIEDMELELQKKQKEALEKALQLSQSRKDVGKTLEKMITAELQDLSFKNVCFKIRQDYLPGEEQIGLNNQKVRLTFEGIDGIEFLISLNLGQQAKPLAKIASGGEVSRVMLALKSIIGSIDSISTMIFDEIDAGIGGAVSLTVGQKLYKISTGCQVICITHLAQIAAFAQYHYAIEKFNQSGKTKIRINQLNEGQRATEIARMLSGIKNSDISLKHAEELINAAETIKRK